MTPKMRAADHIVIVVVVVVVSDHLSIDDTQTQTHGTLNPWLGTKGC